MYNEKEKYLYFTVDQDLVASFVPRLKDSILELVNTHSEIDWEKLILDFSGAERIDSIGVSLIVGLFKNIDSYNREFMIVNCSESILKVLKMFRLDKKFVIGINKTSAQIEEENSMTEEEDIDEDES